MSIINDMLKDLNKRKNESLENNVATSNNDIPPSVVSVTKPKFLSPGFLLVVVLIILIFFIFNNYLAIKAKAKHPKIYQKNQVVAIKDATQFPTITDQFQVVGDMKESKIHLQFNALVSYQVKVLADNIITVDLSKVTVPTKVPKIENTLIKNINVEAVPQALKIKFTLVDGAQLITRQVSGDAKSIDLTIHSQEMIATVDKELVNPALYHAEVSYQQALTVLKDGRDEMAKTLLEKSIAENGNYFPAQLTLIKLFMRNSDFKAAQSYLTLALAQRPNEPDLVLLQASLWIQQNDIVKAEKLLSAHTPSLSEHLDYYATEAFVESKLGNAVIAIQLYEQVLAVNAYNGNWWLGLAIALQQNKQINAATVAYKRALQTNNLNPAVRIYIASQLQVLS